jgi:hypothetical protein
MRWSGRAVNKLPVSMLRRAAQLWRWANMKAYLCVGLIFLLNACDSKTPTMTPAQFMAQQKQLYRGHSTPENVAADPELRALIPDTATYLRYQWPDPQDIWVTSETLPDTIRRYKLKMASIGLIIDYCSRSESVLLTLAQETTLKKTVLSVTKDARQPSNRCDDPNTDNVRMLHTTGCPSDFLP